MRRKMSGRMRSFFSTLFLIFFSQFFAQETAPATENETKYSEIVSTDSLPASELLQRAVNWVKAENKKFQKSSGLTVGAKSECVVTFIVKPKELNPECDYTGKVSMKVQIDCKVNKYRYVLKDIRHTSKNGKTSAGKIESSVPECGSMVMSDLIWKKLKGEAYAKASLVVSDLKEGMKIDSKQLAAEEW